MSLRLRIALILAGVALAVSTTVSVLSYVGTREQLRSSVDETLRSRATAANVDGNGGNGNGGSRGFAGRGPDDDHARDPCPLPGSFAPATAAQIVDVAGSVTGCIDGASLLPTDGFDDVRGGATSIRTVRVGGEDIRMLTTAWHEGGVLQIGRSLREIGDVLARLRGQLLAVAALATTAAAILGWAVATAVTRPIRSLQDTTSHIAATLDLSTPVDVRGPTEIRTLAGSFGTMVAAVARSQAQQRRLVSDASHEMRTPLTSLRSNVELLGRIERLPAEERTDVVAQVLDDVDELGTLLEELVDLASDLATAEPSEPVRLADLARAAAVRATRRTGRPVEVDALADIEIDARPRQLERAIANLIDNALKYSGASTAVEVVVEGTTITVRDRGRGIPPEDIDRIFDRFHRAVDVRSEPGSGLGLAIVEEIVRSHGGSVFARNRDGGGAEIGFAIRASAATGPANS